MGYPPDEHLPEVVPDTSPQALTAAEAYGHQCKLNGSQKFVAGDVDSPKYIEVPVGLECPHDHDHSTDLQSVPWEPQSAVDGLQAGAVGGESYFTPAEDSEKPEEQKKICGIRSRLFYILLAAILVLLAAAVGAGVGVGLANRGSSGSSGSASPTASPSPTPTNTSEPNLNETTRTAPYKFQGWEGYNFTGRITPVYRKDGFVNLPFPVLSYIWDPNNWSCCVTFCANETDTAGNYRCSLREQPRSSTPVYRIHTYCGVAAANGCAPKE